MAEPLALNRPFAPYQPGDGAPDALLLRSLRSEREALSWEELLSRQAVVVLGEAGTGKTTELQAEARRLRQEGHAAFFVRVEDITNGGLRSSLFPKDAAAFDTWLSADAVGWLFLDAVDESKLRGQRLERSLIALAHELGAALARAHLVLSCRVSDWASAEQDALLALLEQAGDDGGGSTGNGVFRLLELDTPQIHRLAAHHQVADVEALLAAIQQADGWSFVERPRDVEWLAAYWNEHGALGSWTELIDHNVDKKLAERVERPSSLSPARVREGAAALACVGTLTQLAGIQVPGADRDRGDAIDAHAVIPDWTQAEIRELLGRGLFDEATYGRVRIHHRSVREYLVAAGLAECDLDALLFLRHGGRVRVPLHLAAVAAWLAPHHEGILRRLRDIAPEHLIDEGDASALAPETRCAVLRSYAKRFGDRERIFHYFHSTPLRRFATPAMVDDIRTLLRDPASPDHLRQVLFEIIAAGELRGSLAEVRAAIVDDVSDVRHAAWEALVAIASDAELRDALATLASSFPDDGDAAVLVLEKAFPRLLNVHDVALVLRRAKPPPWQGYSRLQAFVRRRLPGDMRIDEQLELLRALIADATDPGHEDREAPRLRPHLRWLGGFVCQLADSVIAALGPLAPDHPAATVIDATCELMPRFVRHLEDGRYPLVTVIAPMAHLRREIFWHCVDRRARSGAFPRSILDVTLAKQPWLLEHDAEWLARDACERAAPRERLFAFRVLLQLTGEPQEQDPAVQRLLQASAELRKHLARFVARRSANALALEDDPHRRVLAREAEVRRRKRERSLAQSRAQLDAMIDEVRSGTAVHALVRLFKHIHSAEPPTRAVAHDAVGEMFGDDIAEAAVSGFEQMWRTTPPAWPHEGEANSVPWFCMVGAFGITLATERGLDVSTLPRPLLDHAIGYAVWDRFPPWLSACAATHPEVVRELYGPCLELDYDTPDPTAQGARNFGRLLHKITDASVELKRACAPILRDRIRVADPPSTEVLERVLNILQTADAWGDLDVATLAAARTEGVSDPKRWAVWWRHWLRVDLSGAMAALESALAKRTPNEATTLAETIGEELWDKFRDDGSRAEPIRRDVALLTTFTRLMFRHVRVEDDIERIDAFSPVARDHAQDLRDALVSWLADGGPAGTAALEELAREPDFAKQKDWLQHLAEAHSRADRPMPVADAITLVTERSFTPRAAGDLFTLTLGRLTAIRDNLQLGEFSVRKVYNPPKGGFEEDVQILLADRLEGARRDQYTVARESQDARGDKPDILVSHVNVAAPTAIEVKIAERWSGQQLVAGLRDQLVGKYLRAVSSRSGIYVLCSSGPPRKDGWQLDGNTVDLATLAAHLQRLADAIVRDRSDIDDLAILTIDFH